MKVDHIGCVSDKRGWLYQFINLEKCVGAPVLVALFAGMLVTYQRSHSSQLILY